MTKLRGALFGCGMISEFHLRGWRRIAEVEIVALSDSMVDRAEDRRDQFYPDARTYTDLTRLLAIESLDFVDIITPPALHYEHCLMARDAGLHLICQKPLSDDLDAARRLVAAMRGHSKLFAVHENHRYRPWFQRVLQDHREGFFGRIHLLRLEQHDPREPGVLYKLQAERGVALEYGTHLVDMMRALLGEPDGVYARFHSFNPRVSGESLAHIVYEYAHTTAVIEIAWKPSGLPRGCVLLQGDECEAVYEGTMTRGESSRFQLIKGNEVALNEARSPYDDYVESFYLFQRDCADAMLNGVPVTQTGEENIKTLICTFAAYESAKRGRAIGIAEAVL
jgi:D-apiose dehydrogenase